MPLAETVSSLFTDEWARFTAGLQGLTANEREEALRAYRRQAASPNGSTLIALPGWSEIIHTSTPYQPSADETAEFYRALRAKRPPDLPGYVTTELQRRAAIKERIARSPEPAYAQAFGSILTAIDNVQDFMSTISTTGRLALWAGPRVMQAIIPGASAGTAQALATVAARRAAEAAALGFADTVAARAAAGNLVARLALNNPALMAAARREAIETAAQTAFRLAFSHATLGIAGRLAARFVPVLGWVLLASDLLNLLSFLAMMSTPVYALLCGGPSQALAAGVPAALFKQALKRETWRAHNLNPFTREARTRRALRAAGRLPTISNLLEVAQTTDQLFGIGISLGGLVGLLNGLSFGLYEHANGRAVEFRGMPTELRGSPGVTRPFVDRDPAVARMLQQAAGIAITAPAIQAVQDVFTEDEHLLVALAHLEALALLRWASEREATAEAVPRALDVLWPAPLSVDESTVAWAAASGRDLEAGRRWWTAGNPRVLSGAAYVEHHAARVPGALADFLAPRRSAPLAALYGAVVDQTWQQAWLNVENDPDLFAVELTTDARLVSSFAEEGYIVTPDTRAEPLWAMWQEARALLEQRAASSLSGQDWAQLAARHQVPVVRLLPPDAPVPAAWGLDRLQAPS